MKKQLMWFAIGIIVGSIGLTVLSASSSYENSWRDQDIAKVIRLLEKIADNTAR